MFSINLLFGLDSETLKYVYIGAGALALLIIVLVTVLAVRSKKKKKAVKSSVEAPVVQKEEPVKTPEPSVTHEEEAAQIPESSAIEEPVAEINEVQVERVEQEPAKPAVISESVVKADSEDDADDGNETEAEEDETVRRVTRIDGHVRYIIIKYNKSFTAKIIQSSDEVKANYSRIKNELLSYKGVKARMSWKGETFYSGRVTYAKLCVRGKCLSLFLALDPKEYVDSKYIVEDMSEVAAHEKTPCLYRLKNDRRIKYSCELIETVMQGREKVEQEEVDWASKYPYEETQPLVDRGLIKELTEEDAQSGDVFLPRDYVLASEVNDLLQDEVAVALVEETEELSDKTKTDIVNIDTLGKCFENGETATLEEMKKRIPAINRKATYIKVLARGTLDKKLTVVADSFSIEAVKMILLTGGNAIKKKNP